MLRNPAQPTAEAHTGPVPVATTRPEDLVSLLGEQRAAIVRRLHRDAPLGVGEIADELGVSEVATRRHLAVLEEEGLVTYDTVADGPGRPAKRYRLTERATSLFPQRYASMAEELLAFLREEQGTDGLRAYLTWRLERQAEGLRDRITAADLRERLEQLSEALSDAGYEATVDEVGGEFVLRQHNCTIFEVAREHPEMCALEAATFSQVLGTDVRLSRKETRAAGGSACVCCVTPRDGDEPAPVRRLPVLAGRSAVADDKPSDLLSPSSPALGREGASR